MIVASHQPNFLPYMGFFHKMYLCDVFTLSDAVKFSRSAYHNYNFFNEEGRRAKITLPVTSRSDAIRNVELCNWPHVRKKLMKRLEQDYRDCPYFDGIYPVFQAVLKKDYTHLSDLNIQLIKVIHAVLQMPCDLVLESELGIQGDSPTEQIVDICRKAGASTYLSGLGAAEYLDENLLRESGIELLWSSYEPVRYGSVENASVFDYLMRVGPCIPENWKIQKGVLLSGTKL